MPDSVKILLIVIPIVAILFFRKGLNRPWFKILLSLFLIGISTITILNMGKYVYSNFHKPPEWDFLSFWLYGRVGISGENFYNPLNYQALSLPYMPSDGFKDVVFKVGFPYPPFTMFLFLPLGLLQVDRAYLYWQTAIFLTMIIDSYYIWKLFLRKYGLLGFLLTVAMLIRLTPARDTFTYAQTNFLLLLFFLLFWENKSNTKGGIWLTLSTIVKPYMAFIYLYLLFTGKWKQLLAALGTLSAAIFISYLIFGRAIFISFLKNPSANAPSYVYYERINQSLLAAILRFMPQYETYRETFLLNPLYLGIAAILIITTVIVAFRAKNTNADWKVLMFLFLAMLLYPGTLSHYSVMLILPIVLLFSHGHDNSVPRVVCVVYTIVVYALTSIETGSYTFLANLITWMLCVAYSTGIVDKLTARQTPQPQLSF